MSAVLAGIAAIYVALLILLFVVQRSLLYVPDTQPTSLAEAGAEGWMDEVETRSADGLRLLAWYRPPPAASAPVLVYFHGNAGHIGNRVYRIRPYVEAGFGVLLVEYRGYGGNPGRPTEQGLYADARAAVDFLEQQGVAPQRLVFYGESLGTAVAIQIALERACAALVLEAPFTSVAAVAQSRYWMFPIRHLVLDKFDSLAKIDKVRCPLFVMHGEADGVIPIRFGRQLFDAAPEPKESKWFAAGTHTNFDELGSPMAVLGFLRRYGLASEVGNE